MGALLYFISIQYLRAIAAISVVIFHATILVPGITSAFHVGRAGVDIFFVISGVVMWVSARDSEPREFVIRRLIRIVPLYWAITILLSFINTDHGLEFGFSAGVREFVTSMLFIAQPDGRGGYEPIINPGWTLNLEMYFYGIFALGLTFFRRHLLIFVFTVLAVIVLLSGIIFPGSTLSEFYGSSIVLEFVLGLYLGYWITERPSFISWKAVLLVIFAGVCWVIIASQLSSTRILSLGCGAALIVAGFVALNNRLSEHPVKFFVLLGNASYSIYLIHISVIVFCLAVVPDQILTSHPVMTSIGLSAACIASGLILYFGFERPVTEFLSAWRRTHFSKRSEVVH